MTAQFTRKPLGLAIACTLALGMLSGLATAQVNTTGHDYLYDKERSVVRSGTGLCWTTGSGPAATKPNECEPGMPMAAAAAAKPVVVAAIPPAPMPAPAAARMTLDADALFDFDQSTLRPAGKAALEKFVNESKALMPETITAIGHTDRLGSDAYNQRLSEQRVAAVKAYLVGQGIAADRIQTVGKGESQPITQAGTCAGAKSASVISCLQPDRRVEIDIVSAAAVK